MAITIQNYAKTSNILQSTGTIEAGEGVPRVVFSRKGWNLYNKDRWNVASSFQRDTDFQNYTGSAGKSGPIVIYLAGATRKTNLENFQTAIKSPVYLDCDDVDTNLSDYYKMVINSLDKNEDAGIYTIDVECQQYNNG